MEEQTPALELPVTETTASDNSSLFAAVSALFIIGAVFFAGKGWYTVYDNSVDARIVGGDAYNFIIYAARGTAFVCIGIVCAVLSVTFSVFAVMAKKN